MSNALKFTSSGSIAVSASAERRAPDSYLVDIGVRDTGIGIAPEKLSRLFLPFGQADASISRSYGGTGLGLAISKRLVELMGGGMQVESQLGRGASFRFTVLLGPAQGPAQRPVADSLAGDAAALKVLVAEDNRVNQRVVLKMLERLGVRADLVTTGTQAVSAVGEGRYDLVLMDIEMPEMDGLAATREIRSSLPAGQQPVICGLTAHATTEFRDTCLSAGMNGCLTKPLEPEKLRTMVAEVATHRQAFTSAIGDR
jgi:CheY-like chemotaxis protein